LYISKNDTQKIIKELKCLYSGKEYRVIKADEISQLSKSELVELLIQSEQYIAKNNKLWLKEEFEKHQ